MSNIKVCVIDGGTSKAIEMMIRHRLYYELTYNPSQADIIIISGGADISPSWYGEMALPGTHPNLDQDLSEFAAITYALNNGVPLAGICRGAQFINCLAGGRLRQDVTKHRGQNHQVQDKDGGLFTVNSLHHQMMVPSERTNYELLLWANEGSQDTFEKKPIITEVEALFYPDMAALCFQPHPEFGNSGNTTELFFNYVENLLLGIQN